MLPSRKEGMPNVILEAMACGLPIIGTKISGTEDLVKNRKNGLLIKSGDSKELTKAIKNLLQNEHKRKKMGKESLINVKKLYDFKKIAELYNSVFQETFSEKSN